MSWIRSDDGSVLWKIHKKALDIATHVVLDNMELGAPTVWDFMFEPIANRLNDVVNMYKETVEDALLQNMDGLALMTALAAHTVLPSRGGDAAVNTVLIALWAFVEALNCMVIPDENIQVVSTVPKIDGEEAEGITTAALCLNGTHFMMIPKWHMYPASPCLWNPLTHGGKEMFCYKEIL